MALMADGAKHLGKHVILLKSSGGNRKEEFYFMIFDCYFVTQLLVDFLFIFLKGRIFCQFGFMI